MWWSDVAGIAKTAAEIYRLCVVAIYISGAQIDNQIVSVWDAPASAGDVEREPIASSTGAGDWTHQLVSLSERGRVRSDGDRTDQGCGNVDRRSKRY